MFDSKEQFQPVLVLLTCYHHYKKDIHSKYPMFYYKYPKSRDFQNYTIFKVDMHLYIVYSIAGKYGGGKLVSHASKTIQLLWI